MNVNMACSLFLTKTVPLFKRLASTATHIRNDYVVDIINNIQADGVTACVKGWVKGVRKLKNTIFISVNDGSCVESIQVVLPKNALPKGLSYGYSVNITGVLKPKPNGQMEIHAPGIDVLGKCDVMDGFPFTPGQSHSNDYIRQYLHHRPKLTLFSSILRIRHSLALAVHNYFTKNKFVGVHNPILTSNDCEGAGENFIVQPSNDNLLTEMKTSNIPRDEVFFNRRSFLTVSAQLHLEIITRSIPRVYSFNPIFRAENSKSRLHLSEFYMVEAEIAFIDKLQNLLPVMEDFLKNLIDSAITTCSEDLLHVHKSNKQNSENYVKALENILKSPFTVMDFSEAKSIIKNHANDMRHEKLSCNNLTKEEELFLVKHNGNIPVFVINWPRCLKPFYVKKCEENSEQVQAVDLLVPGVGELFGGSIREDEYDTLHERLVEIGKLKELDWYLELRKFGNVPTGGFGMGFERFIQLITNFENIKDTIPFPRWPHCLQL